VKSGNKEEDSLQRIRTRQTGGEGEGDDGGDRATPGSLWMRAWAVGGV